MILDEWRVRAGNAELDRSASLALDVAELMPLFAFGHLPPPLQAVSAPFGQLAAQLVANAPHPTAQLVLALTLLVQAKDAAVRAVLVKPVPRGTPG